MPFRLLPIVEHFQWQQLALEDDLAVLARTDADHVVAQPPPELVLGALGVLLEPGVELGHLRLDLLDRRPQRRKVARARERGNGADRSGTALHRVCRAEAPSWNS